MSDESRDTEDTVETERSMSLEELAEWAGGDEVTEARSLIVSEIRRVLNKSEIKKRIFLIALSRKRIEHLTKLFTVNTLVEERLYSPELIAKADTKELLAIHESLMDTIQQHTAELNRAGKPIEDEEWDALLGTAEELHNRLVVGDLNQDSKEKLKGVLMLMANRLSGAAPRDVPAHVSNTSVTNVPVRQPSLPPPVVSGGAVPFIAPGSSSKMVVPPPPSSNT